MASATATVERIAGETTVGTGDAVEFFEDGGWKTPANAADGPVSRDGSHPRAAGHGPTP